MKRIPIIWWHKRRGHKLVWKFVTDIPGQVRLQCSCGKDWYV